MQNKSDTWGQSASAYVRSSWHSNEAALQFLVDFIKPSGGVYLDIAAGVGHAGFAIAPHVDRMIALDSSPGMLATGRAEAAARNLKNVTFEIGAAENQPFRSGAFDGAVCRVAAHHFEDVNRFLSEARRTLKSGAVLTLVDTVGSDDEEADERIHELESLRDPTHGRNYTPSQWRSMATKSGFILKRTEVTQKPLNALEWMNRRDTPIEDRARILEIIESSTGWLREYLRPHGTGDDLTFHLTEAAFNFQRD